jgi:hypothetical protein
MLIGGAYLPATVVPVGFTTDGLPLAVQVVGPCLEDRTALAVARALRSALGPNSIPEVPGPQRHEPARLRTSAVLRCCQRGLAFFDDHSCVRRAQLG